MSVYSLLTNKHYWIWLYCIQASARESLGSYLAATMGVVIIKIVNTLHRAINIERFYAGWPWDADRNHGQWWRFESRMWQMQFTICKSMLIYTTSPFLFTFHNTSELWTYNISVTFQFHKSKTFWFYLHQNFLSSSSTNKRGIKRNSYSSSTQALYYVYGIKHCTSWLGERILSAVNWCVIVSHLLFPLFIHTPLTTQHFPLIIRASTLAKGQWLD